MRLNKFLAENTKLSRRKADEAIENGLVYVNGEVASVGQNINDHDNVVFNNQAIKTSVKHTTIILNKPVGFVCSRNGQGSKTIYSLLPPNLHNLNPVGRLDKDSSGLLIMTNDGDLLNELSHPSNGKQKVYKVEVDRAMSSDEMTKINRGIELDDGLSYLQAELQPDKKHLKITMTEGRNRQIRRTFEKIGFKVTKLHRTNFGEFEVEGLEPGQIRTLDNL
ncbi:MAG: pseudouridine synthase [Candidatus Saccharimonadales bacterium]